MKHIPLTLIFLAVAQFVTACAYIHSLNEVQKYRDNPYYQETLKLTVKKIGPLYYPSDKYTDIFCRWDNINADIDEEPCILYGLEDLIYYGVTIKYSDIAYKDTVIPQ